jgi:glycosyltransferase involved in cell wall biosynthesis
MAEHSDHALLVSVIVPAYNASRHILQCLDSIAAQRGGVPVEIIVVDDGSTDDTREKVEAFGRARLIQQENAGPSAARNRGIREAKGEFVAFLDSDDLWTEDKLAVQMSLFRAHPEAALIFGDCLKFNDKGHFEQSFFAEACLTEGFWEHPAFVKDAYVKLFRINYIPTGSVVLRKSCLEKSGLFDESRRYVEDLDLWLRVAYHFPLAYTPHVCQLKRQHEECVSNNVQAMTLAHIDVLSYQRREHGDLLRARGIRLRPRFSMEYCLLGYRSECQGELGQARRWYLKGFTTYPSLRPAYYLLRTLWRRLA